MISLISDICKLTATPEFTLTNILKVGNLCISSEVLNLVNSNNGCIEIDIYWGILKITYENGELNYAFTPSKQLEKTILTAINENNDPLIANLEDKISTKVLYTYKELL